MNARTTSAHDKLTVYVDQDVNAALRTYARLVGGDLSGLVSAALTEYLDRRVDPDGAPREGTTPVPTPSMVAHRRGRPSQFDRATEDEWREHWMRRIRWRTGRPLGTGPRQT